MRRLPLQLLFLPPLLLLLHATAAAAITYSSSAFQPRYAATRPCSLQKELEDICQIKSVYGSNSSSDSFKGLYMTLGESLCAVTISQCRVNTCYSFRDLTQQLQPDASVALTTGFFKDIQVINGAKNAVLTREGFSFTATSSTVRIVYTTQTCAEFFTSRGRIGQQLCNQPLEAITPMMTSTPTSLSC